MGTITISVGNSEEIKLREIAVRKFGKVKGAISKTIVEAINNLEKEESNHNKAFIDLAKRGFHLGKVNMKNIREDMYGRY